MSKIITSTENTENKKMPIVFMFKNQTDFRKDQTIDLKMLNISIRQYIKLYKNLGDIYICGSYNNKEIDDIVKTIGQDYIERKGIKIINIGSFPLGVKTKTQKVNYQAIAAFDTLKEEFIVAHNDVFPIKTIDETYLNKEYGIKYKDYTKIPEGKSYWWLDEYIKTLGHLSKLWDIDLKTIYEEHTFYTCDEETIKLLQEDPFLFTYAARNVVRIQKDIRDGKDVYIPDFIGTTFIANKWVWDKNKEKQYRGIDVTLPNHPLSQKLLKKILKK